MGARVDVGVAIRKSDWCVITSLSPFFFRRQRTWWCPWRHGLVLLRLRVRVAWQLSVCDAPPSPVNKLSCHILLVKPSTTFPHKGKVVLGKRNFILNSSPKQSHLVSSDLTKSLSSEIFCVFPHPFCVLPRAQHI
jgi:hypothetical protein